MNSIEKMQQVKLDVSKTEAVKSCYIHIPFCKRICSYCDFCKNFYDEKIVSDYLDALEKEINNNYKGEILNTLYIGGGTPSSLSKEALDSLFSITNSFNLSKDYEFTFECNFEDINEFILCKLKENKVNRLSIGIQTFNNKFEKYLERNIDKEKMISKIVLAKKYFDNINLDLMYALPGQSLDDLKNDILNFIDLKVNHVSTYALMIEEHTKLGIKGVIETDDDTQARMYELISKTLSQNGYVHYEISNFSVKGFESGHNLTYWNNLEYYGFGAGASGFINGVRYDNTKSIFNYINGTKRIYEEKIDKKQMIKDEAMLGLRKAKGINKISFKNKYGISFENAFKIEEILKSGFLVENKTNVFIPEKYLFVSNEIILKLISSCNLN